MVFCLSEYPGQIMYGGMPTALKLAELKPRAVSARFGPAFTANR